MYLNYRQKISQLILVVVVEKQLETAMQPVSFLFTCWLCMWHLSALRKGCVTEYILLRKNLDLAIGIISFVYFHYIAGVEEILYFL